MVSVFRRGAMGQEIAQSKFAWTLLILHISFCVIYFLLVSYDPSADAKNVDNQLGKNHELEENLKKYPMILDVHMMLFAGFGFLMTFLKRHGFSAVALTMMITVVVTEWAILVAGLIRIDTATFSFGITFESILEGGLAAAAVLISFGAVIGKYNPFQLLVLALVESGLFVVNSHIGYSLLGVLDIGGAIFIHAFGAFFGLAASMMARNRDVSKSEHLEGSVYHSDLFSMLGTIILWIYWPSFNAVLAHDDGFHRAVINTYLSLLGSTTMTFIVTTFCGDRKRMDMVDIANATLSGGVAVGAVADMMIGPAGAFAAGTVMGLISTLGFQKLQSFLHDKIKLHDSCGVLNLHGIPGVLSGVLSIIMCVVATEEQYGPSLYLIFPSCAPEEGTAELQEYQDKIPSIEGGEGRSLGMQAAYQSMALGITLAIAIVAGAITGLVLNVSSMFHPLTDYQLFNDVHFFHMPDEEHEKDGKQIKGDFDAVSGKEDPEGGKEMEDKGIKVAPAE